MTILLFILGALLSTSIGYILNDGGFATAIAICYIGVLIVNKIYK